MSTVRGVGRGVTVFELLAKFVVLVAFNFLAVFDVLVVFKLSAVTNLEAMDNDCSQRTIVDGRLFTARSVESK